MTVTKHEKRIKMVCVFYVLKGVLNGGGSGRFFTIDSSASTLSIVFSTQCSYNDNPFTN